MSIRAETNKVFRRYLQTSGMFYLALSREIHFDVSPHSTIKTFSKKNNLESVNNLDEYLTHRTAML